MIDRTLFESDEKPEVDLNLIQTEAILKYRNKVNSGEYTYIDNNCICGIGFDEKDIIISKKDRYGISSEQIICNNCGVIRTKKRLDDISINKFYNEVYRDIYVGESYSSDKFFQNQALKGESIYKFLSGNIAISDIKTVFEVGCGAGGILYPFLNNGLKVSGCDFGEKYLEYGIENGIDLYHGEIRKEHTGIETQDFIIINHVFEHFTNPIEQIIKISEFSKIGGYIYVEVPGIFNMSKVYHNMIGYFQEAHVYNYHENFLNKFFSELGFDIIYSDESCTFLLKKTKKIKFKVISSKIYEFNSEKILKYLLRVNKQAMLGLNPWYHYYKVKVKAVKILEFFGVKELIKTVIFSKGIKK